MRRGGGRHRRHHGQGRREGGSCHTPPGGGRRQGGSQCGGSSSSSIQVLLKAKLLCRLLRCCCCGGGGSSSPPLIRKEGLGLDKNARIPVARLSTEAYWREGWAGKESAARRPGFGPLLSHSYDNRVFYGDSEGVNNNPDPSGDTGMVRPAHGERAGPRMRPA